ncbi:hypothetical protein [Enterococcus sp. AZ196]|uniref:hypothetical protein n=1 Tax=Enterococcus sp. AZ196 TaxID=2774659 RepID=UPI003D29F011
MTISELVLALSELGFYVSAGDFIGTLNIYHMTEHEKKKFMGIYSKETEFVFSFYEEVGNLTKEESRSLNEILKEYENTPVEARFNQKNRRKTVIIDKGDSFIVRANYDITWRQTAKAYGGRWNRTMKGWEFDNSQKYEVGLLIENCFRENPFPEENDDWEHYTNSQYIRLRQTAEYVVLDIADRNNENNEPERLEQIIILYGDQLKKMTQSEIDEVINKWERKKTDWIKTGLFKEYPIERTE